MSRVDRPALKYFGGKFRMARWVIDKLPTHELYVEPFGGAMSILLRKKPAPLEVYNDLDGDVVNFFKILRERPDELIEQISLTPFSREEQKNSIEPCEDPLERARRLYVRCWQSYGGGRQRAITGWRYQTNNRRGTSVIEDWNKYDHLTQIVDRLKEVQIENDDSFNVIKRFDGKKTLFYCDPPYVPDKLNKQWRDTAYQYAFTHEQHIRLCHTLNDIEGMAILSGYDNELYRDLLSDWELYIREIATNWQSKAKECLWLSPNTIVHSRQLRLEL